LGNKKLLVKRVLLALPGFQWLCRRLSDGHVRVLMYHRFSAENGEAHKLAASDFSRHLAYISRHHSVWSVDQHVEHYNSNRRANGTPVVVTVDDGYADFYNVAFPLLEQNGITATVYVVSGFVDGSVWFWWDQVRYILKTTVYSACDFQLLGRSHQHNLESDSGRQEAWDAIATDLSQLGPEEIVAAVSLVAQELDVSIPIDVPSEYGALTWEQLQHLAGKGIGIGSHTCTHPYLSRVDALQATEEIAASREAIRSKLGKCSEVFCYPYGQAEDYSSETTEIVRNLGFAGAYVAYEPDGRDLAPYELKRYSALENYVDFCWKLCGAQLLFERIRSNR